MHFQTMQRTKEKKMKERKKEKKKKVSDIYTDFR